MTGDRPEAGESDGVGVDSIAAGWIAGASAVLGVGDDALSVAGDCDRACIGTVCVVSPSAAQCALGNGCSTVSDCAPNGAMSLGEITVLPNG